MSQLYQHANYIHVLCSDDAYECCSIFFYFFTLKVTEIIENISLFVSRRTTVVPTKRF